MQRHNQKKKLSKCVLEMKLYSDVQYTQCCCLMYSTHLFDCRILCCFVPLFASCTTVEGTALPLLSPLLGLLCLRLRQSQRQLQLFLLLNLGLGLSTGGFRRYWSLGLEGILLLGNESLCLLLAMIQLRNVSCVRAGGCDNVELLACVGNS